jgi:GT2 family glycosyltransferase
MTEAVDVVVLTWNDGAELETAVHSALGSTGVDVHVIIVDNGSSPPAPRVDDGRVHLIRSEQNLGVAAGRNRGVLAGAAPYVCLLDSDARLHRSALESLLHAVRDDDRVALAGPVFTNQPPEASGGRAPTVRRKLARALNLTDIYESTPRDPDDRAWDVDFVIGACQLFRRAAYEQVGGIDESFFYGPEDVDFCLRLKDRGWRIVQVGRAGCDHPPRRRFRQPLTRRGVAHAWAIARHLWRHRGRDDRTAGAARR